MAFNGLLGGSACLRIYLLDFEAGTPAEATGPPNPSECVSRQGDFWPTWSPDGRYLLFEEKVAEDRTVLQRLNLDTRAIERLDPRRVGSLADWR